MARQSKDSSGITAEDVLHRPLKRETFSGRMARLRSEKATPEERALRVMRPRNERGPNRRCGGSTLSRAM